MTYPQWLPELFSVNPWTESTYSDLHHIFIRDFIDSQPQYQGQAIWFFPEMEDGKHVIFWHLTTSPTLPWSGYYDGWLFFVHDINQHR